MRSLAAAIHTIIPRHKPVPDIRNLGNGCVIRWIGQVFAVRSSLQRGYITERTSNR